MSTDQEHEIVPAIRDWLAATSDLEIPPGLSRDESRQQARGLLSAIAAGSVVPHNVEAGDDLKDILWASVEELEERPLGPPTFENCDRFYQFVTALRLKNDLFDEREQILHRVARTGWRSAPGGLEAVLKARAAVWEHGDELRHREVCETADQLPARIKALTALQVVDLRQIREICSRLVKLAGIYPSLAAPTSVTMEALLVSHDLRIGRLDDLEHLKAATAFAAGMAGRNLGRWDWARSRYEQAARAFRRTADTSDLDRVDVENLALQVERGSANVAAFAPALIRRLVVQREKIKAQLILAQALVNLDRPEDARLILETVREDPALEKEPALHAFLFIKLGTALSYLGKDAEAIAAFNLAGSILRGFSHPMQFASLTGSVGEHLGKLGRLSDAKTLYLAARSEYERIGLAKYVAYSSVLVAEMMILLGKNEDAESELLATLPLIERFDLRGEAIATAALLREALGKRGTDVTAIRELRDQLRKDLQ